MTFLNVSTAQREQPEADLKKFLALNLKGSTVLHGVVLPLSLNLVKPTEFAEEPIKFVLVEEPEVVQEKVVQTVKPAPPEPQIEPEPPQVPEPEIKPEPPEVPAPEIKPEPPKVPVPEPEIQPAPPSIPAPEPEISPVPPSIPAPEPQISPGLPEITASEPEINPIPLQLKKKGVTTVNLLMENLMAKASVNFPTATVIRESSLIEKWMGRVHLFANGDRYEGEFINCQKHGQGSYRYTDGTRVEGC